MRAPEHAFLSSRPAFEQFVAAWEAGTLPKPQWTHAAHVAVSACYTVRFDESAFDSMKAGILRYNEAVGTINGPDSGYHETLTRFWSTLIARHLQGITDPWQAACRAVEQFGEGRTPTRSTTASMSSAAWKPEGGGLLPTCAACDSAAIDC